MEDSPYDTGIEKRLLTWLAGEGYPLEFSTATAFRKSGFRVHQGYYTHPQEETPAREVDIVASMTHSRRDYLLRVEHVVECKWSDDKPWMLFCGGSGITTAACIAHTTATELGETLLLKDAGSSILAELELFRTPDSPAFGGRQGFSGSRDILFDALRAITSSAHATTTEYDRDNRMEGPLPRNAIVTIPLIVISGRIFEVRQDDSDELTLTEVMSSRVHWRGVASTRYGYNTIDIVRSDYLDQFLEVRSHDVRILLDVMSSSIDELVEGINKKSLTSLSITTGTRGVIGSPPLIRRLRELFHPPIPLPTNRSTHNE